MQNPVRRYACARATSKGIPCSFAGYARRPTDQDGGAGTRKLEGAWGATVYRCARVGIPRGAVVVSFGTMKRRRVPG